MKLGTEYIMISTSEDNTPSGPSKLHKKVQSRTPEFRHGSCTSQTLISATRSMLRLRRAIDETNMTGS
jgi:hypothetical protein